MLRTNAMTIGQLSRRTGVPIKVLRHYEDLGFLYTLGRTTTACLVKKRCGVCR
jgi:hypothetical protein